MTVRRSLAVSIFLFGLVAVLANPPQLRADEKAAAPPENAQVQIDVIVASVSRAGCKVDAALRQKWADLRWDVDLGQTASSADVDRQEVCELLQALRAANLAKVLAEPSLVSLAGRSASFQSGGQVPIPVASGDDRIKFEYVSVGTRLDFLPKLEADGKLLVESEIELNYLDPEHCVLVGNVRAPGRKARRRSFSEKVRDGQSFALLERKGYTWKKPLPFLADLPVVGRMFQREVTDDLLFLVTVATRSR